MSSRRDITRSVKVSERLYRRLLCLYPRPFRREYGEAMSLLFRDQCRDALDGAGPLGLVKLWLRVLADTGTGGCREHLLQLQQAMNQSLINSLFRNPTLTFAKVFSVTFLLLSAVIVTVVSWLPKVYLSTARVAVEQQGYSVSFSPDGNTLTSRATGGYDPYFMQTEFEKITSKNILNQVIEELGLTQWLAQQTGAPRLTLDESYQLLRRMVNVRPFPNSGLVEVRVFSEDRVAAAEIANKIVDVYRLVSKTARPQGNVEVADRAEPSLRPVRPNLPLNLFLGLVSSLAFSAILALALLIRRFASAHSRGVSST